MEPKLVDKLGTEILVGDTVAYQGKGGLRIGVVARVKERYVSVRTVEFSYTTLPVYDTQDRLLVLHPSTALEVKHRLSDVQQLQAR